MVIILENVPSLISIMLPRNLSNRAKSIVQGILFFL